MPGRTFRIRTKPKATKLALLLPRNILKKVFKDRPNSMGVQTKIKCRPKASFTAKSAGFLGLAQPKRAKYREKVVQYNQKTKLALTKASKDGRLRAKRVADKPKIGATQGENFGKKEKKIPKTQTRLRPKPGLSNLKTPRHLVARGFLGLGASLMAFESPSAGKGMVLGPGFFFQATLVGRYGLVYLVKGALVIVD
jgi:hypothetical protein